MKGTYIWSNTMVIKKRTLALVAAVCVLLGYAAAYFSKPEEVREVVKYKEAKDTVRIVTKYVYPDGTTKEQTVEKDKSVVSLDSDTQTVNRKLGVRLQISKLISATNEYRLDVQAPPLLKLGRMQLGIGASVDTNKEVYGGIYVQF